MFKKLINLLKALAFGTIGGLLGALGGTDGVSKGVRRIVIPVLITLYALCTLHNWWLLTLLSMIGVFSMGYGVPDISDGGSLLGRFWERIFHYHVLLKTKEDRKNRVLVDIFTRGTVGVACCLSLLSIPLQRANWGIYGLCCIAIIAVYSLLSWRNLGQFKFRDKKLNWSEFLVYFTIMGAAQICIGI